jgi:hypothetical protein
MKGKVNFKLGALCAILSAMLVIPALVQAKDDSAEHFKAFRAQLIKSLKLAPDKEKAVMAVEDKYAAERQEIISGLKKTDEELRAALAPANPDEAKVKGLVSAITAGQDKMFASFKNQQSEELALMTPIQQGKYLMALREWRHKMMEEVKKKEAGKKKK